MDQSVAGRIVLAERIAAPADRLFDRAIRGIGETLGVVAQTYRGDRRGVRKEGAIGASGDPNKLDLAPLSVATDDIHVGGGNSGAG